MHPPCSELGLICFGQTLSFHRTPVTRAGAVWRAASAAAGRTGRPLFPCSSRGGEPDALLQPRPLRVRPEVEEGIPCDQDEQRQVTKGQHGGRGGWSPRKGWDNSSAGETRLIPMGRWMCRRLTQKQTTLSTSAKKAYRSCMQGMEKDAQQDNQKGKGENVFPADPQIVLQDNAEQQSEGEQGCKDAGKQPVGIVAQQIVEVGVKYAGHIFS